MALIEECHSLGQVQGRFDRVDPHILFSFPELVRELGGDPECLLQRVGVHPVNLQDSSPDIGYRQVVQLVAEAADRLVCPDFGMRLAKRQAGSISSPLQQLFENCATLGHAFEEVVNHSFAHSLAAGIWLKRSPSDETVTMGHDILIDGIGDRRQAIEHILLIEYMTCREATGGLARARRVDFRHQPISAPALYRKYFGCEVRFGQQADAIAYGEQTLALPITAPDPAAFRRVIADIDRAFDEREPPLYAKVRGVVLHWLGIGPCSNIEVAKRLGIHARTMHRQLRQHRMSFQQIKDQVREELLVHYLDQTNLPLSEISERLGFAEQSALSRFCRQRLAVSPRERRMRVSRSR